MCILKFSAKLHILPLIMIALRRNKPNITEIINVPEQLLRGHITAMKAAQ